MFGQGKVLKKPKPLSDHPSLRVQDSAAGQRSASPTKTKFGKAISQPVHLIPELKDYHPIENGHAVASLRSSSAGDVYQEGQSIRPVRSSPDHLDNTRDPESYQDDPRTNKSLLEQPYPKRHDSTRSATSNSSSHHSLSRQVNDYPTSTVSSKLTNSTSATSLSYQPLIRSIHSTSSIQSFGNTIITPQASQQPQFSRPSSPSLRSEASHQSFSSILSPAGTSHRGSTTADGDIPPRPDDSHVLLLFAELINKMESDPRFAKSMQKEMNLKSLDRRGMEAWPIDMKWQACVRIKVSGLSSASPSKSRSRVSQSSTKHSIHMPPSIFKARSDMPSAESYISAFMDGSIDMPKLKNLEVALRSYEISWVEQFTELSGQQVLADALSKINRLQQWTEASLPRELQLLKCLKAILNSSFGSNDAFKYPKSITAIAYSITSPNITTRKATCDILTYLAYYKQEESRDVVENALEDLMKARNDAGKFDAWFTVFEGTVDGRGRMGSKVGASGEIRSMESPNDTGLNEYALSNVLLINALLEAVELEKRVSLRAQMEASGIQRILDKLTVFKNDSLTKQLKHYEITAVADFAELQDKWNRDVLTDMTDPTVLMQTILKSIEGSRAQDFFISALKHLLLIRFEGDEKVLCFQLVDRVITGLAIDRTGIDADLSTKFGTSLADLARRQGQLHETTQQLQEAGMESEKYRRLVDRLRNDKRELETQLESSQGGLVSQLKVSLGRTEEELRVSRQATKAIQKQLDDLQQTTRKEVAAQDLQIKELYTMLQESKLIETVTDIEGVLSRREVLDLVKKKNDRTRTILALEGRSLMKGGAVGKRSASPEPPKEPSRTVKSSAERKSRYEDAEEDSVDVRRQIEDSLARGASSPFSKADKQNSPQSTRNLRRAVPHPWTHGRSPSNKSVASSASDYDTTPQPSRMRSPDSSPLESYKTPPMARPAFFDQIKSRRIQEANEDEIETDSQPTDGTRSDVSLSTNLTTPDGASRPAKNPLRQSHSRESSVEIPLPPPKARPGLPFLAGIASAGLKPSLRSVADRKTMEVPEGSLIAEPGSFILPPAPPPAPMPKGVPAPPAPFLKPSVAIQKKNVLASASQKTRQVQWDAVPFTSLEKTVFGEESEGMDEASLVKVLQDNGLFQQIEEDYKARQITAKIARNIEKQAQLKSFLDNQKRQQLEIILKRSKCATVAEQVAEIAARIQAFDEDLCTEAFLKSMLLILPDSNDISKLSIFCNESEEVLDTLHPADRLMIALLQLPALDARIKGMAYQVTFDEAASMLKENQRLLIDACDAMKDAVLFKHLLKIALAIGNFLNASTKGGAFGFRLSSLNKFIDTKGEKGVTLLHTMQQIVSNQFPQVEGFLEELSKPILARRVNLDDVGKGVGELSEQLTTIRAKLQAEEAFKDLDNLPSGERYPQIMFPFTKDASSQLRLLKDQMVIISSQFQELKVLYHENAEAMKTNEFFGILDIFVATYTRARKENTERTQRLKTAERIREAQQAARRQAQEQSTVKESERSNMDDLLSKLRSGDLGRKTRQIARRKSSIDLKPSESSTPSEDLGEFAMNLLKQLDVEGFQKALEQESTPVRPSRRSNLSDVATTRDRRRTASLTESSTPSSASLTELADIHEETITQDTLLEE